MNTPNENLITHLTKIAAFGRFSQERKDALSNVLDTDILLNVLIDEVSITRGYVREDYLRNGKTISARLPNTEQRLKIRCQQDRNDELTDVDAQQLVRIRFRATEYDDVRKLLIGVETPNKIGIPPGTVSSVSVNPDILPSDTGDEADAEIVFTDSVEDSSHDSDTLSDDLARMQSESLQVLDNASDDLQKAAKSNVELVADLSDPELPSPQMEVGEALRDSPVITFGNSFTSEVASRPDERIPAALPVPEIVIEKQRNEDPVTEEIIDLSSASAENLDDAVIDLKDPEIRVLTDAEKLDPSESSGLREEILGDSSEPIWLKQFSELISAETGVAVRKVREIQQRMWNSIVSPEFFGEGQNRLSFFPFGNFELRRNGRDVNLDFASHSCEEIADYQANENVRFDQIANDEEVQSQSPVANQALRIAFRIAPLVGLSPPLSYKVIFETLLLLLKVFGVGKRRVRFTDIGEFFPVLLRGTLQYHFRPYRPLIRLASQSFRKVIDLAEHEGDGHLQFVRDQGVPSTPTQRRSELSNSQQKKKTNVIGWIVLAIFGWLLINWVMESF